MPIVKNDSGLERVFVDNFQEITVNVDGLESLQTSTNTKLDTINTTQAAASAKLPSALTGSGNLKVCIQELGNEGSERLNVDIGDSVSSKLPTALTGAGNLKVSIQESFGAALSTNSVIKGFQQGTITEKTILTDANGFLVAGIGGYTDLSNISSHTKALIDSEGHFQVDVVGSVAPSGVALASHQTTAHGHQTTAHGKQDTMITHLSNSATDLAALEVLHTATNSKIDTFDAVLDASLVKQTNLETLLTAANVDHAANEVLLTSILAKAAPVKTVSVMVNNETIGGSALFTSPALDCSTVKHIGFSGSDTGGSSGTVSLLASATSSGTYIEVATGTFNSSKLTLPPISNLPFKFLKVAITNDSAGNVDYTLNAFLSS